MEQNPNERKWSNPPRRRRKRTKWQNFKEAYLPVIIFVAIIVLIVIFVKGSFDRAAESRKDDETTPSDTTQSQAALLQEEAETLMALAEQQALTYDYNAALDTLNTFSGDMNTIPELVAKYDEYSEAYAKLVPYTDVTNIPNLSFNTLMADVTLAQTDSENGDAFSQNYITCSEFSAILQKLYDGGYVLVSPYDIASVNNNAIAAGTLYLPQGKKPIVLTLSGANYYSEMEACRGFASKLVLDSSGKLTNELVQADGSVTQGSLDFIPILSDFVAEHPDFSYHGARAIVAVSGYEGMFGYGSAAEATDVIEAVKAEGYDFACYTYDEKKYGDLTAGDIEADLVKWTAQVEPHLGDVDILVYPYGSDFTEDSSYSGAEYSVLSSHGFRYLIGTDSSTPTWGKITDAFMLQTRRWVNGTGLAYRAERYEDLFTASAVFDQTRQAVPR